MGGVANHPLKTADVQMGPVLSMSSQTQPMSFSTSTKRIDDQPADCIMCGISSPTKKKQSQVWRVDFQSCCKKLRDDFKWADIVRKAGVEKKNTRTQCMKNFTQLKYEFDKKLKNRQVPNSAQVRQLLNCSALLQQNIGQDACNRTNRKSMNMKSFKSSFGPIVKSSFVGKSSTKKGKKAPMVSMLDENMKALFLPKKQTRQIDDEIQSSIYLFVKFTQLLQKHSQQPNNAICRIRLAFINYIKQTYGICTRLTQQQDDQLTSSIRQFINLYTVTIDVYYKVSSLTQNQKTRYIFSQENIKSVATVILFKNDGFYKLIFGLYENTDKPIEEELNRIIKQRKNVKPQDLKIAHEYCLNQLTLNWYLSKASLQRNGLDEVEIPTNSQCQPFETCIMKLKQIQQAQTPISKLKVIISTADKISGSINRFYQINSIPDHQMVDSDQILTIFIYIILHSGISNLKTHLRFVQNFCTEEQLLSQTGYYSKVAQGALRLLIQDVDEQFY